MKAKAKVFFGSDNPVTSFAAHAAISLAARISIDGLKERESEGVDQWHVMGLDRGLEAFCLNLGCLIEQRRDEYRRDYLEFNHYSFIETIAKHINLNGIGYNAMTIDDGTYAIKLIGIAQQVYNTKPNKLVAFAPANQ